jgi:hypothetical protein
MAIKKIKRTYRKTKYILYKETLVDFKEHFWAFIGSFAGIKLPITISNTSKLGKFSSLDL